MNNETTASQPKSIGDDAQFWDLLEKIEPKTLGSPLNNLIGYIDSRSSKVETSVAFPFTLKLQRYFNSEFGIEKFSAIQHKNMPKIETYFLASDVEAYFRAPAAQASAPIQAAPDANELHFNAQRLRNVAALVGVPADGDDAHVDGVRGALLGLIATKLRLAATIQEPVMVAEPKPTTCHGNGFNSCCTDACDWKAKKSAAPMVADPAGVAKLRAALVAAKGLFDECSMTKGPIIAMVDDALAATVKAVPSEALSGAARDVLAERQRQVETEGWTPEHDDMHDDGQMAVAAGFYALQCGYPHERTHWRHGEAPMYWPWAASWWKPTTKRANLIKAGALILAEIERIDRAAPLADKTGGGE